MITALAHRRPNTTSLFSTAPARTYLPKVANHQPDLAPFHDPSPTRALHPHGHVDANIGTTRNVGRATWHPPFIPLPDHRRLRCGASSSSNNSSCCSVASSRRVHRRGQLQTPPSAREGCEAGCYPRAPTSRAHATPAAIARSRCATFLCLSCPSTTPVRGDFAMLAGAPPGRLPHSSRTCRVGRD